MKGLLVLLILNSVQKINSEATSVVEEVASVTTSSTSVAEEVASATTSVVEEVASATTSSTSVVEEVVSVTTSSTSVAEEVASVTISSTNEEVAIPTVCNEPSCPIGCTLQTSYNGSCVVCECKNATAVEEEELEEELEEGLEEDVELKPTNCTEKLQFAATELNRFFKIKLRNFTCQDLLDQHVDGRYENGTFKNETKENIDFWIQCMLSKLFVTEIARHFGLEVNVTCIDYENENGELVEYNQSTECKLSQFFVAQTSRYFNMKISYKCPENYGEDHYDENFGNVRDSELDAENKTSNNCKLKKFVGAYKVKNLNSKENEDCEDEDEERDDDIIANTVNKDSNKDSGKDKLSTNCKLRKFVGAYKVKNLNSEENEDCEDEEEKVDDGIDVNKDEQDSDNDKSSSNCKLRKFLGGYKVKNLNSEETEDCEEDGEDENDYVNNEGHDFDNDKSIDEATTTNGYDEDTTTKSNVEEETTHSIDEKGTTKPDGIRCKLRQFLAAHISKNFNAKSIVDCDNEEEEDDEEEY